jgi:restriction system protein
MTKQIPKFHETFIPILKSLESKEEIQREELKRRVIGSAYADLPQELLNQKISSGGLLIVNRIGWGVSYLKQGKFVEQPRRGYVKITSKGMNALKSGKLTYADLKKDNDYLLYQDSKDKARKEKPTEVTEKDYTPQDLIEDGFTSIKQNIKAELLERLKNIDPFYFEKVILILLKRMGYGEFVETKKTGDGGIDGIINQDQLGINKIYIQAKRYAENKVREKDIRNFIGAMSGDTMNGVFVTTSTFDDGAVVKAREAHHKIILIDGFKLTELMFEFGVGVQTTNTYELKEVDDDFFDTN